MNYSEYTRRQDIAEMLEMKVGTVNQYVYFDRRVSQCWISPAMLTIGITGSPAMLSTVTLSASVVIWET
ncbi:hypothetical protein [Salmonella enterica]|uniref:hypothetical protein n=1 Tax=Salmonella enterica TaxID=28901 RepID=UPI003D31EF42